MYSVKVIGAGSIGNHLTHAARSLGWNVTLCDVDEAALKRTKEQIYPGRYGRWDDHIVLQPVEDVPRGGYDLICIGTPPDSHLALALSALEEKPRGLLVEKPLCTPDLVGAQTLFERAAETGCPVFVGYDHVVSKATQLMEGILRSGELGTIETLDVEFREHWGGIFAAHPWLDGPGDTYLGSWRRGGGATGEHSHAANLWQHLAHVVGAGKVAEVTATVDYVRDGQIEYDRLALLNLRSRSGLTGRVVQDVVTRPARKWARIQGERGYAEWYCGYRPGEDAILWQAGQGEPRTEVVRKTRPDDFIMELKHIQAVLEAETRDTPLGLEKGLDTMLVIAAAHRSSQSRCTVRIDHAEGYRESALKRLKP
jgi:predicted dehydrogenase